MKHFYLILSILFISSCSSIQKINSTGDKYKISAEMNQFLLDFENAARNHKETLMLSLMDYDYKQRQLEGMLEGRTKQFLNEFFSGELTSGSGFKSVEFNSIFSISFVSITQTDVDFYDVLYIVKGVDFQINGQWQIKLRSIKGKTVFGLIGAEG